MPAFSHFFLKRLSARSKFSSSWIMTSDKFYFPPSWRLCAGLRQTVKLRRGNWLGQAKPSLCFGLVASLRGWDIAGTSEGVSSAPGSRSLVVRSSRCGTMRQSLGEGVTAPIVARGSSPTRTPSDFPSRSPRRRVRAWRLVRARDLLGAPRPAALSGPSPARQTRREGGDWIAQGQRRGAAGASRRQANEVRAQLQVRTGRRGCPRRRRPTSDNRCDYALSERLMA